MDETEISAHTCNRKKHILHQTRLLDVTSKNQDQPQVFVLITQRKYIGNWNMKQETVAKSMAFGEHTSIQQIT
jgi:hypothetical protein